MNFYEAIKGRTIVIMKYRETELFTRVKSEAIFVLVNESDRTYAS